MAYRLDKQWIEDTKNKLEAGRSVRMTTSTRKSFLLGNYDQGLGLQWRSLGSGVWEAQRVGETNDDTPGSG